MIYSARTFVSTSLGFFRSRRSKNVASSASSLWASRSVFVAVRYLAAALVAIETLLFARILGPENYGQYALILQTASLLALVGLGAASGYVYAYYRHPDKLADHGYLAGAVSQYVVGALLGTVILYNFESALVFSGLLFLIYIPYLITEPMLRVRNRFTLSVVGRALGPLVTILIAIVLIGLNLSQGYPQIELKEAIWIMLLGNFAGYATYYLVIFLRGELPIEPRQVSRAFFQAESWRRYWRYVLRRGIPENLSTVLFLVFMYVDRFFIERYRSAVALSVYSMGWQLAQGAVLMMNSLNVISGIRIGESMSNDHAHLHSTLRRQLTMTMIAGLLAFSGLVGGTILLNRTLFQDYKDLVIITIILSMGYFAISIVGSVSSVLTYDARYVRRIIAHVVILVMCIGGNIIAVKYRLWYGFPVLVSSLALFLLSVWMLKYSYRIAQGLSNRA